MKTCPHCGASLSEKASFCPHCAKSLIEKTDLKPYRTPSIHKFLFLLIPILILGSLFLLPWGKAPAPAPSENTEISATLTDADTEITDSANPLPSSESEPADTDEQTDAASSEWEASTVTEDSALTTDSETPTDDEMEAESNDPISDPVTGSGSESNTASVTDSFTDSVTDSGSEPNTDSVTEETQIIYTPETAPLSGTYVYKGVEWYYETPATNPNQTKYPYKTRELACITGVNSLAEDGIYYVPETVHGKHVLFLQMSEYSKAHYNFESTLFKENVKQIYFPPSAYGITTAFLTQNTTLTDVFIAGEDFFLNLYYTKGNLTVHSSETCVYTANTNRPLMKDACTTYSNENKTVQWEEWDPSTLYPNS